VVDRLTIDIESEFAAKYACDNCHNGCQMEGEYMTANSCHPCTVTELLEKLAAYEETGLTPERAAELAKDNIPAAIDRLVEYESLIHLKTAREWVKAHEEGRLVVLPCKAGDIVYKICPINLEYKNIGDMFDGKIIKTNCDRCAYGRCGCVGIMQIPTTVTELKKRSIDWIFNYREDFGKTIFLTRAEAEYELEKMKGGGEV
jgi:hypothetical protein